MAVIIPDKSFKTISFFMKEGTGIIELNSPPSNIMTSHFFSEFSLLIERLKDMKDIRSIIITGRGRHFSSGADIDELLESTCSLLNSEPQQLTQIAERNCRSFSYLDSANIPVIAAIRGVCLGSAFELALSCHFRFCGKESVFGLPECTYNLIPGLGGIGKVEALSGKANAISIVLKGNTFDARSALNFNLVDHVVTGRNVLEDALAFARNVSQNYHIGKRPLYLKRFLSHGKGNL